MLRVIFVFYLLCLNLPLYVYSEDEFLPPLSAVMQSKDQPQRIIDSPDYVFQLEEDLKQSIRSPRQLWHDFNSRSLDNMTYEYLAQWESWYLEELPMLILTEKSSKDQSGSFAVVSQETIDRAFFLFHNAPFDAQAMIDLANHYNYNRAEKLNLFLAVLNLNISEKELLKVMAAWNILDQISVYVQEYEKYLDSFFDKISEDIRAEMSSRIRNLKTPVTTVLHQVMRWGKITLFNQMMEQPEWDVNARNYLLRTGLYESSDQEWSRGGPYVIALLEHPEIDINARDVYGRSPIFPAIQNSEPNSFTMVQKYFEYRDKLDLSIVDHHNRGLVLFAAESGLPGLAEYLHKQGAPFPKEVSSLNSYITDDYRAVFFQYRFTFHLDNVQTLFDYTRNNLSFPIFDAYLSTEKAAHLSPDKKEHWEEFRYYFLFRELSNIFAAEESLRYRFVMSSIYGGSTGQAVVIKDKNISSVIAAIYGGDMAALKEFFSKKENREKYLNGFLFQYPYQVKDPWSKKIFTEFVLSSPEDKQILEKVETVYFEVGTFLGEAVRANSVEAVSLLLDLGVDPTQSIINITLKNAVIAAILNGRMLHEYPNRYAQYLVILEKIMNHPSVTRTFLNQNVFPGINYADLAALEGNLQALKWIYKKGASVSQKTLWSSRLTMEMLSYQRDFMNQTVFLLEEKLKERDTEDRSTRDFLSMCRGAFH